MKEKSKKAQKHEVCLSAQNAEQDTNKLAERMSAEQAVVKIRELHSRKQAECASKREKYENTEGTEE